MHRAYYATKCTYILIATIGLSAFMFGTEDRGIDILTHMLYPDIICLTLHDSIDMPNQVTIEYGRGLLRRCILRSGGTKCIRVNQDANDYGCFCVAIANSIYKVYYVKPHVLNPNSRLTKVNIIINNIPKYATGIQMPPLGFCVIQVKGV